jgi:hypothetical protein
MSEFGPLWLLRSDSYTLCCGHPGVDTDHERGCHGCRSPFLHQGNGPLLDAGSGDGLIVHIDAVRRVRGA